MFDENLNALQHLQRITAIYSAIVAGLTLVVAVFLDASAWIIPGILLGAIYLRRASRRHVVLEQIREAVTWCVNHHMKRSEKALQNALLYGSSIMPDALRDDLRDALLEHRLRPKPAGGTDRPAGG